MVLETSGVPIFDSAGSLKGYRGIDRDITERKRAEETIKYQTYHDLLTGLPNRTLFTDLLDHEILEMQRLGKDSPCSSWTSTSSKISTILSDMRPVIR